MLRKRICVSPSFAFGFRRVQKLDPRSCSMKEMRYSPLPRKSNCNENMAIWQTNSLKSQIVPPKKGAMFSRLYGIVGVSASLWELAQFLGLETEMGVSSCYNHGESMCRC